MQARVEGLSYPHHPVKSLLAHIFGWALFTMLIGVVRRIFLQPSMERMSEQWLVSHQREFTRDEYLN
jgi:hypothetical protein